MSIGDRVYPEFRPFQEIVITRGVRAEELVVLEFILEHAKVDKYNSLLAHVLVYKTYKKSRMVCSSCVLG